MDAFQKEIGPGLAMIVRKSGKPPSCAVHHREIELQETPNPNPNVGLSALSPVTSVLVGCCPESLDRALEFYEKLR